jgi:predicted Kef-type K+ transport protein
MVETPTLLRRCVMSDLTLLVWVACGVIGAIAAHVRGWSVLVGFLAGVILGPFAVLLFIVSGIASNGKTCPQCAERIKENAKICRFCRSNV